jgi:hypothetical protein
MGMIGNAPVAGILGGGNIQDGSIDTIDLKDAAVTAQKVASGVAVANLGFTPVNKAGDTITGHVGISGSNGLDVGGHLGFNRDQRDGSALIAGEYRFQLSRYSSAHPTSNSLAFETYDASGATRGTPFIIKGDLGSAAMIKMNNQPGFGSYRSGSNTDGYGVNYSAMAGAFNTGNHFNTTTGVFTAPIAGKYVVPYIMCRDTSAVGRGILRLYINGVAYAEIAECYGAYQDVGGCVIVNLGQNDSMFLGFEVYGTPHTAVFGAYLLG